jgi:F-type H+-transporting ATPase subunit delta
VAVAQRMYARALFEAAREADRVDAVAGDLAAISGAMDEVPELRAFLRNPQIDPAGKADVLGQVAAGADELVRNFVELVAD